MIVDNHSQLYAATVPQFSSRAAICSMGPKSYTQTQIIAPALALEAGVFLLMEQGASFMPEAHSGLRSIFGVSQQQTGLTVD